MLSNPDHRFYIDGKVEVDSRSETDQAKDFTHFQDIACLGIADDPPCHETGDLDQEDFSRSSVSRSNAFRSLRRDDFSALAIRNRPG